MTRAPAGAGPCYVPAVNHSPTEDELSDRFAEIEAQIADDPQGAMAALDDLGEAADSDEGRYLRAAAI